MSSDEGRVVLLSDEEFKNMVGQTRPYRLMDEGDAAFGFATFFLAMIFLAAFAGGCIGTWIGRMLAQ